jgi:hypothetical protein
MSDPVTIKPRVQYGTPDPDPAAYNRLVELAKDEDVTYILHHQRVPIDARTCLGPGSVKVQAVIAGGKLLTVKQSSDGELQFMRNW